MIKLSDLNVCLNFPLYKSKNCPSIKKKRIQYCYIAKVITMKDKRYLGPSFLCIQDWYIITVTDIDLPA